MFPPPYPSTSSPDGGNVRKRIAYELFTRTSYVFWIFFASVYFPLLFFGKGVFFLFFFFYPFPSVPENQDFRLLPTTRRPGKLFVRRSCVVSGRNRVRKRSENQKFSLTLFTPNRSFDGFRDFERISTTQPHLTFIFFIEIVHREYLCTHYWPSSCNIVVYRPTSRGKLWVKKQYVQIIYIHRVCMHLLAYIAFWRTRCLSKKFIRISV